MPFVRATFKSSRQLHFFQAVNTSFTALAVVCIDLQLYLGKLTMLQGAATIVEQYSTTNKITADVAFVDGMRCAQGKPQMDFFSKMPEPLVLNDEEGGEEEDEEDELTNVEEDVDEVDGDDDTADPDEREDRGARMAAVERRAAVAGDNMLVIFHGAARTVAAELINTWAGLDTFCRSRLDVDAKTLLAAWVLPMLKEIEAALRIYKDIKPDPAKAEAYAAMMCKG